jgi:dTDP-4-amino-4,6-dideoxygalactose transaminase
VVDPAAVAAAVTPRRARSTAVHLFGRPVGLGGAATAVPQEVALAEDAAGALGARYRDAVRRRRRRVSLVPPAQDRDDG